MSFVDNLHPRRATDLFGHSSGESIVCSAIRRGSVHHAWLITGACGIGKASFAYHFARFLLANQSAKTRESIVIDYNNPVFQQVANSTHPDLMVIEQEVNPKTNLVKDDIFVDQIRALNQFFSLSPSSGKWRVAIIDSADDMNRNAANAFLKILEEPPANSVLLLISHASNLLLPTIRSRCIKLPLKPLSLPDMNKVCHQHISGDNQDFATAIALYAGSPGQAIRFINNDGGLIYSQLLKLLSPLCNIPPLALNWVKIHDFIDKILGEADNFLQLIDLILIWISRIMRVINEIDIITIEGELPDMNNLWRSVSLKQLATLFDTIITIVDQYHKVHLDQRHVAIVIFSAIERILLKN